jgi:homogentisate 1,2-dioxygenase
VRLFEYVAVKDIQAVTTIEYDRPDPVIMV